MMNHRLKKRVNHNLLIVLALLLMLANLLPIVWMVYCGFKDNNEILSGAVLPGRRHNDAVFLAEYKDRILLGTSDGGISLLHDQDLRVVEHLNLGTFATSYWLQGTSLWVLSSNHGLQEVELEEMEVTRTFPPSAMAKHYPGEWNTLWVNDIPSSSLAGSAGDIYFSFEYDNFPGLGVFDPEKEMFSFPDAKDRSFPGRIRQLTPDSTGGLLALTSEGFFQIAVPGLSVNKSLLPGVHIPASLPGRFQLLDSGRVLMAQGNRAYLYQMEGDSILAWMDAVPGMNQATIVTTAFHENNIWLGHSQAAVGVRTDDLLGSMEGLPMPARLISISGAPSLEKEESMEVSGEEVSAILPIKGSRVILGGPMGAIAMARADGSILQATAPKGSLYIHWRNYIDLWRNIDFGLYLKNSFIICLSVMVLAMVIASLGGYALARYNFPGKNTFGYSVLATQMVPGIMLLIPIYLMFINITDKTGIVLKGTYIGMILTYAAYFVPFSIWILRGFFASIPKELEEAALIDGCGPFRAFFQIILPSAMPGIIATGVYVFLSAWDELMFAWVLTSEATYTIPVGIRLFVGNFQNRYDLMMAAATVSTIPVMVLFFMMQKQIVSGLTAGAVKD